jgi:cellobiose-specific phosphotransferase system component IIB
MNFTKLDYCQYLLSSQVNYTLTNLAEHLDQFSHDTINRCSYIQARAVEILSYVAWDLSAVGGDAAAIGVSRR